MTNSTSWLEIVSKGLALKVPQSKNSKQQAQIRKNMDKHLIFEHPDLKFNSEFIGLNKYFNSCIIRPSIFQQSLNAYAAIESNCGKVLGFRCLNKSNSQESKQKNFLIEAKFANEESRLLAINKGITIDDIEYHGTPCYDNTKVIPAMTRVYLSGVPPEEEDTLKSCLIESMKCYGQVVQILILKDNGYFEGEVSVLLNRSSEESNNWDRYVPAQFKGAPQACFHCRLIGHMKKDCPVLASIKCYNCNGRGHVARNCRDYYSSTNNTNNNDNINNNNEIYFTKELNNYIKDSKMMNEDKNKTLASDPIIIKSGSTDGNNKKEPMTVSLNNDSEEIVKDQSTEAINLVTSTSEITNNSIMECDIIDITKPEDDIIVLGGSLASKFAPVNKRTTMDCDDNDHTNQYYIKDTEMKDGNKIVIKKRLLNGGNTKKQPISQEVNKINYRINTLSKTRGDSSNKNQF
ncbi:unnamed protein product [Cunninghamella echinulata]